MQERIDGRVGPEGALAGRALGAEEDDGGVEVGGDVVEEGGLRRAVDKHIDRVVPGVLGNTGGRERLLGLLAGAVSLLGQLFFVLGRKFGQREPGAHDDGDRADDGGGGAAEPGGKLEGFVARGVGVPGNE